MRPSKSHIQLAGSLAAVAVLSACAQQPRISSQQESSTYLSRAGRSYSAPGPAGDPWGPYIVEASAKYDVPQRWIREVMRQESGGRLYGRGGSLITSGAGAMGLMQVMPGTYDELRARYPELGNDPFDPHNNILAGTAYIREMYDIYGSPGFLAAYNAGPGRLDDYLTRSRTLPEETRRYVASIGPRLGGEAPNRASPGAQYALNALPLAIPDGPRYASAAPVRASVPSYEAPVAVAAAFSPAPAESGGSWRPGQPIRLSPQREAPIMVAEAEPIRLQPVAEPIRLSPPPAAEPIRLSPQPVEVAEAPAPQRVPARPAVSVLALNPVPYTPPAAPVRSAPVQVARLAEPPARVAPPRVQYAQAPAQTQARMPLPPEPPRQYASMPFSPPPRPLAFSLVSRAYAEPIGSHHGGATGGAAGGWAVQVGAFANEHLASAATQSARGQAREVLAYAHTVVAGVRQPGGVLYRARLTGLSRDAAAHACERLARNRTSCMIVSPDAQSY